jgi:hypothetical protein
MPQVERRCKIDYCANTGFGSFHDPTCAAFFGRYKRIT